MTNEGVTRPIPFTFFVMKVASRCNLNCNYCCIYNMGDLSYLRQPAVIPDAVVTASMQKIRRHGIRHRVKDVAFVLHGGEPMMAGRDFFRRFVSEAQRALGPEIEPHFMMQTNGTLIDQAWLDLFSELQISFGISLDGPEHINDASRVPTQREDPTGRFGAAIDLVLADPRCMKLFGTILTVVNLASDPLEFFCHFKEIGVGGVDFLLLMRPTNVCHPAYRGMVTKRRTPTADWLISIFDEWFAASDTAFRIRFFENIMALIFGSTMSTDNSGGRHNSVVVIGRHPHAAAARDRRRRAAQSAHGSPRLQLIVIARPRLR